MCRQLLILLKPYHTKGLVEAGCDEAGRGCLAGPVFAAAVILPPGFRNAELNDSKQLNEKTRYKLRDLIENEALHFSVSRVEPREIDEINILNASILAMHKAVNGLKRKPELLIVDGNRFKPYMYKSRGRKKTVLIPHHCIIQGDAKYMSIAAASILAKTYRDDYMNKIHREFPAFHWDKNKGYPTAEHRREIKNSGPSPYHRLSFKLLETQYRLEF